MIQPYAPPAGSAPDHASAPRLTDKQLRDRKKRSQAQQCKAPSASAYATRDSEQDLRVRCRGPDSQTRSFPAQTFETRARTHIVCCQIRSGALRVYYSLATIHLSRSFWVFSQKYGIKGLDPIAPHGGLVKQFELHVCGHRNHHEIDLTKEIQLGKITMIITQHG